MKSIRGVNKPKRYKSEEATSYREVSQGWEPLQMSSHKWPSDQRSPLDLTNWPLWELTRVPQAQVRSEQPPSAPERETGVGRTKASLDSQLSSTLPLVKWGYQLILVGWKLKPFSLPWSSHQRSFKALNGGNEFCCRIAHKMPLLLYSMDFSGI